MKNWKKKILAAHKSFTSWFNTAGIVWLQMLVVDPDLKGLLDSADLAWVLIVGNIVIRVFKTNKAIEDK